MPAHAGGRKKKDGPGGWLVILGVGVLVATLFVFFPTVMMWVCGLPAAAVLLILAGLILRFFLFRHNSPAWLSELAGRPLRMLRSGQKHEDVDQAFDSALVKARSFAGDDYRRGIMLSELAVFAEKRGRRSKAASLHREALDILSHHEADEPMLAVNALNNFSLFLLHGRDFDGANRELRRALELTKFAWERAKTRRMLRTNELTGFEIAIRGNLASSLLEMNSLQDFPQAMADLEQRGLELDHQYQSDEIDGHTAMRVIWCLKKNDVAEAERLSRDLNSDTNLFVLRARAKLHLIRKEFAAAQRLLEGTMIEAMNSSVAIRPELLDAVLDYAECLFALGSYKDALAMMNCACVVVQFHQLPRDELWRVAVDRWLPRAREQGAAEVLASLEVERQRMPDGAERSIKVVDSR